MMMVVMTMAMMIDDDVEDDDAAAAADDDHGDVDPDAEWTSIRNMIKVVVMNWRSASVVLWLSMCW